MQNEMKLENWTSNASMTIEEGLDFILSHFDGQRVWPRKISTKVTECRQVIAKSREEALARFEQANFLDCRISAYPPPSDVSTFVGVNLEVTPSIVMIDLDKETFKTQRAFEMALTKTLRKISETIISEPTVIWSGGGYHIYLVLDAFVLEGEDAFNNSRFGSNPSQKFLRFAEWFLSNGRCDPQHNKTVSLRNCMLRIPGSINSKNGQTVRVVKRWNGFKPNISYLLGSFHSWLVNQSLKGLQSQRCNINRHEIEVNAISSNIRWIENLLQTPIADFRKLAIWRVLVPYLLNIRALSPYEAQTIIHEWLDKCSQLRRLDFNPNHRIKSALNSSKGFLPISCEKLMAENKEFYSLLQENRVLL
jgi:hypothetical protein